MGTFCINIAKMRSLLAVFLLSFVQLVCCQVDYDELFKDLCFRNIYICNKHPLSLTTSDDLLETSPKKFREICRRHKTYITCVDDAVSKYCNEPISDLAQMILDNRISLKWFCTDPEWKERYDSSTSCINENKEQIEQACKHEEEFRVDDRPLFDYPEPCDAIQRMFNCAVQKMEKFCGETATEVYKRIRYLDGEDLDVVCEVRRRNPMKCQYEPEKKRFLAVPKNKVASSCNINEPCYEGLHSEVRKVILNSMKTIQGALQRGLKVIDSKNVKLQKLNAIDNEESEKYGYKLNKRFGLQEFDIYSDIAKIKHLKKLAEFEQIQFRRNSNILKDLHLRIKNYLFGLVDVLRHKEIIIGSLTEELFEIYWTNLEFPVESIVCDMINIASKNVFKCSIKWDLNEKKLNAGSVSNSEDKRTESIPKDNLSDVNRAGDLVEDGFLHRIMSTDDYDDAYLEEHRQSGVVPSPGTESSIESQFSTGPSTESDSESIPEPNSASLDLKTSFVEGLTETSQLREIEDAIDEKLQIVDVNMESNKEENHSPTDKPAESYGIGNLDFADPDTDSKEDIPVAEAPTKLMLERKPLSMDFRRGTMTSTEDPFYEQIEKFLYEDSEKLAREKELEYFAQEMEKMRALDRETTRLAHDKRRVSSNIELPIKEREELYAREKEEREKNKEKYLVMEIEQLLKEREERRARKREMERIMDEQDDEFERARKEKEIEFFRLKEEILASERAKAGSKPTLRHEEL